MKATFQVNDDKPVGGAVVESETLRILKKGRDRIERGYIKGQLATDAHGHSVHSDNSRAAHWCTLGSIDWGRPTMGEHFPAVYALVAALSPSWLEAQGWEGAGALANFNNSTSKEDVLALFDRAIASEQEKAHSGC